MTEGCWTQACLFVATIEFAILLLFSNIFQVSFLLVLFVGILYLKLKKTKPGE